MELALVISNNSRSGAMEYARERGIESSHVSAQRHGGQEEADEALFELLKITKIDLIVLAGYLKKLPPSVVEKFAGRIINVHPALLPSFGGEGMYGERVHAAVLARGCKISGATAHLVTSEYDEGPILLQECCPVTEDDSVDSLARKVREIEFRLLPAAVRLVADRSKKFPTS